MIGARTARTARSLGALAMVAALALGACAGDQDPGLTPDTDGPAQTSNTLGQCPAAGPDATTPPAGCLDADGQVLRP